MPTKRRDIRKGNRGERWCRVTGASDGEGRQRKEMGKGDKGEMVKEGRRGMGDAGPLKDGHTGPL